MSLCALLICAKFFSIQNPLSCCLHTSHIGSVGSYTSSDKHELRKGSRRVSEAFEVLIRWSPTDPKKIIMIMIMMRDLYSAKTINNIQKRFT